MRSPWALPSDLQTARRAPLAKRSRREAPRLRQSPGRVLVDLELVRRSSSSVLEKTRVVEDAHGAHAA
jgi:hypothetical protein